MMNGNTYGKQLRDASDEANRRADMKYYWALAEGFTNREARNMAQRVFVETKREAVWDILMESDEAVEEQHNEEGSEDDSRR